MANRVALLSMAPLDRVRLVDVWCRLQQEGDSVPVGDDDNGNGVLVRKEEIGTGTMMVKHSSSSTVLGRPFILPNASLPRATWGAAAVGIWRCSLFMCLPILSVCMTWRIRDLEKGMVI